MYSAHVDALKSALEPLGYDVYFTDVPETPEYPYVLLWLMSSGFGEENVADVNADLDWRVGVTMTAGTGAGALIVQEAVRGVLMPGGGSLLLDVGGRRVELVWRDGQAVRSDMQVKVTGTNRFPAYAVDIYELNSTPSKGATDG